MNMRTVWSFSCLHASYISELFPWNMCFLFPVCSTLLLAAGFHRHVCVTAPCTLSAEPDAALQLMQWYASILVTFLE